MERLRIGMVGLGMARWLYGPAFCTTESLELVAVVDRDPTAIAQWTEEYGEVPVYGDYGEFLENAAADAVLIATPVAAHCEMVEKAAHAGKHVFCEKPMARTVGECDRMIDACKENGVKLMIGFSKRWDKGCILAKQLIDAGELGEVYSILCDRSFYEKLSWGYRGLPETLGGILQDHGAHTIDLCRWWLGDVERVSAELRIFPGEALEELAFATLRHENKAISCHKHSKTTHLHAKQEYIIDGEKASLRMFIPSYLEENTTETFTVTFHESGYATRNITPVGDPDIETEIREKWPFKLELDEFARCVREGADPSPSGEDGRKTIEVINAGYISAWRGETVKLPLSESPDLETIFEELRVEHHS